MLTIVSYADEHGHAYPRCKLKGGVTCKKTVPHDHRVIHTKLASEQQPEPSSAKPRGQHSTHHDSCQSKEAQTCIPYIWGSIPDPCRLFHNCGSTLFNMTDWIRLQVCTIGATYGCNPGPSALATFRCTCDAKGFRATLIADVGVGASKSNVFARCGSRHSYHLPTPRMTAENSAHASAATHAREENSSTGDNFTEALSADGTNTES